MQNHIFCWDLISKHPKYWVRAGNISILIMIGFLISKWNILENDQDCDEEALILVFFQNSVFTEKEANEEQDKERKDSVDV